MGRIRRSWSLTKASLGFIRRNPKLLVFPTVSIAVFLALIVLVLVAGSLFCGIRPVLSWAFMTEASHHLGFFVPAAIISLLIANFVFFLCQAALIGCVLLQMEGKPHGRMNGLRLAWSRRAAIVKWTLVTVTIGLLLRLTEQQFNRVPGIGPLIAKWVFRLVGASWALVTFLVVPVIVFEPRAGIWTQLRRSGQLFRRSWGEQLVGRGFIAGPIVALALLMTLLVGIMLAATGSPQVDVAIVISVVACYVFVSPLIGAMESTYVAVLYGYAVTGMLPQEFSSDLLPPTRGSPA